MDEEWVAILDGPFVAAVRLRVWMLLLDDDSLLSLSELELEAMIRSEKYLTKFV